MRKVLLVVALLVLTGCARAQETVLAQASSSDGWSVVAATRHGHLKTGYNDIVIAVQDPMRAYLPPGDVQISMKMVPEHPQPNRTPPPIEMQPDGQHGHWLAIAELPHADTWRCDLDVMYKNISHKFAFHLHNKAD